MVVYVPVQSITWYNTNQYTTLYTGFTFWYISYPPFYITPSILDGYLTRSRYYAWIDGNMVVNNHNLISGNAYPWFYPYDPWERNYYYIQNYGVADEATYQLTMYWVIDDGFTHYEYRYAWLDITFLCGMESVTRANTWSTSTVAITIFDPASIHTRLLE